ncbi:MAG: GNAT family N-acetyltransferase [Deltaproteobacteria bacterium]|nr:GNAT family N-acetyltransferase [Deltaproteobacteria bacterium]
MLSWNRNKIETDGWSFGKVKDFSIFSNFDCADPDLNDFIRNDAELHRNELIVETYEFRSISDAQLVAFVSLANDCLALETNRQKRVICNRVRYYSQYPAVKIARLGVAAYCQNVGIGSELINIIKELFTTNNRTGCRFITVDAYNNSPTIKFYQKNDFEFLRDDDGDEKTRIMYYDLKRFVYNTSPVINEG